MRPLTLIFSSRIRGQYGPHSDLEVPIEIEPYAPLVGPNLEAMLSRTEEIISKLDLRRVEIEDEIARLQSELSRTDIALSAKRAERNGYLADGLLPGGSL